MYSPGAVVLAQWHLDSRFLQSNGQPRDLDIDGESLSFTQLVRLFAGDIPVGAMKTELIRMGAIIELENGKLRPLKRVFIPDRVSDRIAMSIRTSVFPLLESIAHNCSPDRALDLFFQRTASVKKIPIEQRAKVRNFLKDELVEFSQLVDDYLEKSSDKELSASDDDGTTTGVGFFYYETDKSVW